MDDASELDLYPRWRQAVREFLSQFKYGDLVPHEWLEQHFGMPSLAERQRMTARDFSKRQFEWLQNIEAFKSDLLREHQVCLQAVRGEGYRWVMPHEQTKVATDEMEKSFRRTFTTGASKLKHVRTHELNEDQQRERVDAISKLASLRRMSRQALTKD